MTIFNARYQARRMVNFRPIGEILAEGTEAEVAPFWKAGEVAICWTYDQNPPRQLSKQSLASVRQKRLRRKLEKKHPLFAAPLFDQEIEQRADFFKGERE
jgi:hypothetical protein